jgi:O-acetyl-ADP-ribose deacetylase (regulator of RNase III)
MMTDKIQIIQGDITRVKVDAIVNAANNSLLGGAGVDGAIHRAGGKEILEACIKIGGCETGEAVITTGGKLPARFVIHTVGPVWQGGSHQETAKLAACYRNSLHVAVDNNCKSIAFPNISTGAYDFPKQDAARIAVSTVKKFIEHNNQIDKVLFVCYDKENFELITEAFTNSIT